MASIRVPPNVSSITFTTSGVKTPTNGIISGLTPAEVTTLIADQLTDFPFVSSNQATGVAVLGLPPGLITSITINATPYTPNASTGYVSGVPAADATIYLGNTQNCPANNPFWLIQG